MIIAIGAPGAMPRVWLETNSPMVLAVNIRAGEVAAEVASLDAAGRPVSEPLPAATDIKWPVRLVPAS